MIPSHYQKAVTPEHKKERDEVIKQLNELPKEMQQTLLAELIIMNHKNTWNEELYPALKEAAKKDNG